MPGSLMNYMIISIVKDEDMQNTITLVNVYVDLLVFTRIAGTS